MKTTITKKLLGLALSVFSITAIAQCPTITSLSIAYGAPGTATITPTINGTVSPSQTTYYWQVSSNVTQTSQSYQSTGIFQYPGNGTYSVCLTYVDSLTGCSNSSCTNVTISNMAPVVCNAAFTSYTDSNCVTHFTNTSTGTNLSYYWTINGINSGAVNPTASLANGVYYISLRTFSNGVYCDSAYQSVSVSCGGGGTNTPCQASFTYYTDSTTCLTHFTNTTPCTYSTSSWVINGTTYYTANPVLSLPNSGNHVQLNVSINGAGVSSTGTQTLYINCSGSGTTTPAGCQANSSFYVFADSTNAGNYFAYNYASGSGTLSYLWNFGDGTSSTQQYPFHQYAIPGQYVICLTVTATSGTTTCSDTYCDSSSVQRMAAGFQMSQVNVIPLSVTGIKQTKKEIGLKAFPNPMTDELAIEATTNDTKLTFVLVDALGRIVLTGNLNNSKTTINTSNLEKGFYSLSVTNEKGSSLKTIKLVK